MTAKSVPTNLSETFGATVVGETIKFEHNELLRHFLGKIKNGSRISVTITDRAPRRTSRQNRALHVFFEMLAKDLNDAGLEMPLVLSKKVDVAWTPENVKELLWRPAQKALCRKESTTELRRGEEIDKVYEHLVRHLGEKFGFEVPEFPHYENETEFINASLRRVNY